MVAGGSNPQASTSQNGSGQTDGAKVPDDISAFYEKMDADEEDDMELKAVSVEINQDMLESLQKR